MQAVIFSAERSLLGQGKKGADMSTSGGYIKSLAKPRSALRFSQELTKVVHVT